jgi:hypothetical protein
MSIAVVRLVTPRAFVHGYQRFGGKYSCLFTLEDAGEIKKFVSSS